MHFISNTYVFHSDNTTDSKYKNTIQVFTQFTVHSQVLQLIHQQICDFKELRKVNQHSNG